MFVRAWPARTRNYATRLCLRLSLAHAFRPGTSSCHRPPAFARAPGSPHGACAALLAIAGPAARHSDAAPARSIRWSSPRRERAERASTCPSRSTRSTARPIRAASCRSTCPNRSCACPASSSKPLELRAGPADVVRGFGARATFGVRGVRLYQDDIPATMPDGQGQTGSFSLVSAQRIEVLRGPFSTLYGNAVRRRDLGVHRGRPDAAAGIGAADRRQLRHLECDREIRRPGRRRSTMSSRPITSRPTATATTATRRAIIVNAKLTFAPAPDTTVTMIGNSLHQPDAQDPLGLTRAQWEADPRQADPAAMLLRHAQDRQPAAGRRDGRAALRRRHDLRVTGYGGTRQVRQYLALPGTAPTSSGGVTDLDRNFGGVDARLNTRFCVRRPAAHADPRRRLRHAERAAARVRQQQRRRWAICAATRTTRSATPTSTCRSNGRRSKPLSLLAGVRYSDVRFESTITT